MARDLPAELWLEVVSYLPRGHVRKLLGINRCLTEMALDEIYHSFTLDNGFQRAVSDIQRTTEPRYASRVKRLEIHSCFLARSPEADDGLIIRDLPRVPSPSPKPKPEKKGPLRTLRTRFGSLVVSSRKSNGSQPPEQKQNDVHNPPPIQPKVLAALNVALSHWRELEEINLLLHDYVSMPTFSDFLVNLWSQRGESIRTLNIRASPIGLFNFILIASKQLAPFPSLEHLSLLFTSPETFAYRWNPGRMGHRLATFIRSHEHSLHTLIISEPVYSRWIDTLTLIQDLGCLPELRKIEVPVLMEGGSYSHRTLESLEKFLRLNACTLESLVMGYRPLFPFASPHNAYLGLIDNALPKLCFPILSELDMEVYVGSTPRPIPFRLPLLRHFAPNLRKLNLKGSHGYLSDYEFASLLENLSTGAIRLQSFNFQMEVLRPENLDQLALNLPTLKSLSITYIAASLNMDGPFHLPPSTFWKTFNREYVDWPLKYLRLAKWSACKGGHPDYRLSARVAKSIPGLEINDISRSCNCVL